MQVTEFQPPLFVLPWLQFPGNGYMRLHNKMWFVIIVEFHEPLCICSYIFYQILDGHFAGDIDIDGMRWKTAVIFQLHFNRRTPHRYYFQSVQQAFFHHAVLHKIYQRNMWLAVNSSWVFIMIEKMLFHLHDLFP